MERDRLFHSRFLFFDLKFLICFFFSRNFWPEAKLEPFSFLFWISSIHPSFIRGPLRLGYLIFFFFLPGTKTKTVSPESENARVCVCACAFALSYYIQQCERRRERESGAHRRPSGLYFFSEMIETERNRDGRKEIPFVFDLFLSLSPLDRKLTFSCVLCQVSVG